MLRNWLLPIVSLGCLVLAGYHVAAGYQTVGEAKPPVAPAARSFADAVAGVGMIEPCSQNIAVASPLPGVVAEVFVRVGQTVQAGDPLFRLDNQAARAELKIKEAALTAAAAQLQRHESLPRPDEVPVAEARLREAQAALADQEEQLARTRLLYQRRALSEEELRRREHAVQIAQAQLARSRAELDLLRAGGWSVDKSVLQAAYLQAEAQKQQAETEVARCLVRASIAGEVLQLNVRPGEFVGTPPGQPLVVLGDVTRLHVRVDIDENDIGRFQPGARGRATLRGDADREFALTFVRIEPLVIPKKSLTGDNTERVDTRVLQVLFALQPDATSLYVGQQVDVFIERGMSRP